MSKQYVWIGCVVLALTVIVVWYISRDPYGPSANDLRVKFAVEIPAYLRLMSFDVQASAPIGDKVEPAFKARFHASVRLESDTYDEIRREGDIAYARLQLKTGDTKELYGIAFSTLKAGSWQTAFTLEGDPLGTMGRPPDLIVAGRVFACEKPLFPAIIIGARDVQDQEVCTELTPKSR